MFVESKEFKYILGDNFKKKERKKERKERKPGGHDALGGSLREVVRKDGMLGRKTPSGAQRSSGSFGSLSRNYFPCGLEDLVAHCCVGPLPLSVCTPHVLSPGVTPSNRWG